MNNINPAMNNINRKNSVTQPDINRANGAAPKPNVGQVRGVRVPNSNGKGISRENLAGRKCASSSLIEAKNATKGKVASLIKEVEGLINKANWLNLGNSVKERLQGTLKRLKLYANPYRSIPLTGLNDERLEFFEIEVESYGTLIEKAIANKAKESSASSPENLEKILQDLAQINADSKITDREPKFEAEIKVSQGLKFKAQEDKFKAQEEIEKDS